MGRGEELLRDEQGDVFITTGNRCIGDGEDRTLWAVRGKWLKAIIITLAPTKACNAGAESATGRP